MASASTDDLATTRTWLDHTTALFLDAISRVSDDDLEAPSRLPGWSRKHVIAHVHQNALAVGRLVSWAATGIEQAMYPEPERRQDIIEEESRLPAPTLRALVLESAHALDGGLAALTPDQWNREVLTIIGTWVPARALPYMRTREIAVHAVDLDAGIGFADLPDGFVRRLLGDAVETRIAQGHGPALAAWLTGRESGAPQLGPWI